MFDYNFDLKTELEVYEMIGCENHFHNYGEWENYVFGKYNQKEYTSNSLNNFAHYLKQNQRVIISKKESWSSTKMPMITLVITILFTSVFSVIGVINNYNNAINTCTGEEFLEYTGYSAKMIYEALEQNLYTGMYFYIFGMVVMSLSIVFMIIVLSSRINAYNLKEAFYDDYIHIVEKIIDSRKINLSVGKVD